MSDIVERLRKVESVERELAHDCDMPPEGTANWEYAETCKEAAAEIERLRAELQNLGQVGQLSEELERLRAALRLAQRGLNPYATYETQLEARVVVDGICAALGERT